MALKKSNAVFANSFFTNCLQFVILVFVKNVKNHLMILMKINTNIMANLLKI
jgi:hypothetical protein